MSPHATDSTPSHCLSEVVLLKTFGITANAFLPSIAPLQLLPDEYYASWELLVHNLPALIRDGTLRDEVQTLDVLSTDRLLSEAEWRRAYVVLAFLAQGYIWGGDVPAQILPPALSIPFLEVSRRLDLPPVLTYAASNLWNFSSRGTDFSDIDGLRSIHTFTGTEDESWFLTISVAMEAKAGYAVSLMVRAMQATKVRDYDLISQALEELSACIRDVGSLLERMDEKCNPSVFFNHIRPFLAGSRNMAEAGLPNGVFYDEGDGRGSWRQLRGGSNGQSSLIQFFDTVLGVEHTSQGNSTPHSKGPQSAKSPQPSFHEEVRGYMPAPHRRFLQHIRETCKIRELSLLPATSLGQERLRETYSMTVRTLSEFRNKHIQLVTRYIVLPSRQANAASRKNLASASMDHRTGDQELTGTGGTLLLPFLKQSRDETAQAAQLCE
ncbi:hypothetical protein LTR85_001188 [Meristemomyces frigidus]|nr:hypothetical protein LTR85_001188 [Meristemomyces frigidus]